MQGIGNDFVMVDAISSSFSDYDLPALAIEMNNRRFGIGGDGLILAFKGKTSPFEMRMFNPDGSESEMCGNGIRCFAKFLRDLGYLKSDTVQVDTGAGALTLTLTAQGQVRVDMGFARLSRSEIGMLPGGEDQFIELRVQNYFATAVSMGNPHIVIFVPDVQSIDLEHLGPLLENDPMFSKKTNVHFVQVVTREHLIQRTWERGAGITLACGTGACSVAVAGFLTLRSDRNVLIDLPGGRLEVEYRADGRVFMTGPAETVFIGQYQHGEDSDLDLDLTGIREVELLEHI